MKRFTLSIVAALIVLALVAPSPAPAAAHDWSSGYAPAWIAGIIRQAAARHGVSADALLWLAACETGETFNPYAVSPVRFDGGRDLGLFQFHRHPSGWTLLDLTPYAGGSPFDVWTAANGAAWLVARGYGPHWLCWSGAA